MSARYSPWHKVVNEGFRAMFFVGLDQDPDTACNVDVEIVLPDGSRWAATLITIAEIRRLMTTWRDRDRGPAFGGRYFWCPDALIVREPGVANMAGVIAMLLRAPDFTDMFRRLPD